MEVYSSWLVSLASNIPGDEDLIRTGRDFQEAVMGRSLREALDSLRVPSLLPSIQETQEYVVS